ncbi:TrmH family RNA methyltransferase [Aquimarina gracilis]|uniref:TrmH family RNA methyltransferase n=1 Tax=Aquimarina gracilis TaxID=874422 RepID=A0ABU6A2Q5_9FLAO|nr:TrmH family RNA methyltransferase [Aquimarina gracilis]MEB3348331.1 TrmH family RNA methyltransferase [Aquimarina gracilis]
MDQQLNHNNNRFIKKQFPITLVCDSVNSPANIGSIFRIADSFGVEQIYFCGEDITIVSKRMQRTARSTHEIVPYQQSEEIITVIQQLIAENYTILSLEITKDSIPISECTIAPSEKIALVIGEENFGVSQEILSISKQSVHINMYGNNSSMNVATATGIALYEITKQWLVASV